MSRAVGKIKIQDRQVAMLADRLIQAREECVEEARHHLLDDELAGGTAGLCARLDTLIQLDVAGELGGGADAERAQELLDRIITSDAVMDEVDEDEVAALEASQHEALLRGETRRVIAEAVTEELGAAGMDLVDELEGPDAATTELRFVDASESQKSAALRITDDELDVRVTVGSDAVESDAPGAQARCEPAEQLAISIAAAVERRVGAISTQFVVSQRGILPSRRLRQQQAAAQQAGTRRRSS